MRELREGKYVEVEYDGELHPFLPIFSSSLVETADLLSTT